MNCNAQKISNQVLEFKHLIYSNVFDEAATGFLQGKEGLYRIVVIFITFLGMPLKDLLRNHELFRDHAECRGSANNNPRNACLLFQVMHFGGLARLFLKLSSPKLRTGKNYHRFNVKVYYLATINLRYETNPDAVVMPIMYCPCCMSAISTLSFSCIPEPLPSMVLMVCPSRFLIASV